MSSPFHEFLCGACQDIFSWFLLRYVKATFHGGLLGSEDGGLLGSEDGGLLETEQREKEHDVSHCCQLRYFHTCLRSVRKLSKHSQY